MPARKKNNKSNSETSSSDKKKKGSSSSPKTKTSTKAKKGTSTKKSPVKKSTSTKKSVDKKSSPKKASSDSGKKKEIKVETSSSNKKGADELKLSNENENKDVTTDLGFDEIINRTQIDSQKKFYHKLNKEIEQKNLEGEYEKEPERKPETEPRPIKKSVGLYRKRAFFFITLTVLLLFAIFYFSFSKLTIAINSSEEVVNNNVLIDVYSNENNDSIPSSTSLNGSVMAIKSEAETKYQSSGEEIIGEEIVGTVKIINNYSKSQPLVATTRLLSPDDKLYRIKETVNVPANSSVEVEIYADEVKKDRAIKPTTFTIPGLWAGLQDDIYAESEEAFVYRTKTKDYVTVSDIEDAKEELEETMISKAKKEANRMFDNRYHILYDIDNSFSSFNTEAKAGDEIAEFSLSGESQVVVVAFLKEQAKSLAKDKLSLLVPGDKEFKEFNESNLSYTLDSYSLKEGTATVKINFSGLMTIDDNTEIIDRSQLVNLNREQIRKYLDTYPEIKNYTLDFQPAFLNKAPSLADRIEVKLTQ
jgi:molybdopterin converting factor small subunit